MAAAVAGSDVVPSAREDGEGWPCFSWRLPLCRARRAVCLCAASPVHLQPPARPAARVNSTTSSPLRFPVHVFNAITGQEVDILLSISFLRAAGSSHYFEVGVLTSQFICISRFTSQSHYMRSIDLVIINKYFPFLFLLRSDLLFILVF